MRRFTSSLRVSVRAIGVVLMVLSPDTSGEIVFGLHVLGLVRGVWFSYWHLSRGVVFRQNMRDFGLSRNRSMKVEAKGSHHFDKSF